MDDKDETILWLSRDLARVRKNEARLVGEVLRGNTLIAQVEAARVAAAELAEGRTAAALHLREALRALLAVAAPCATPSPTCHCERCAAAHALSTTAGIETTVKKEG